MLFAGYDPGGDDNHGVAVIKIIRGGAIEDVMACDALTDVRAAWDWFSKFDEIIAFGIDKLLAGFESKGRGCDNYLRDTYKKHQGNK